MFIQLSFLQLPLWKQTGRQAGRQAGRQEAGVRVLRWQN
jgi:hypothetical protein